MSTSQAVSTFTGFFRERGHQPVRGGSLLSAPGDPVLFTSAGMHPLTPYLGGRPHPLGRRLTGVQRCLRTTDLDEVGDDSHLTVFQMLGSWSLGDYDGPQSQRWGLELLCDGFGLDRELLFATVFGGDGQCSPGVPTISGHIAPRPLARMLAGSPTSSIDFTGACFGEPDRARPRHARCDWVAVSP